MKFSDIPNFSKSKPVSVPAKNIINVSDEKTGTKDDTIELGVSRKATYAKKNKYKPLVWFLSPNSKENASWLATKDLDSSIKNGVQILVCLQLWLSGIRTPRMFKYSFPMISRDDPDRFDKIATVKENAEKYFPELLADCPGFKFKFTFAKHTTTKWIRMCKEHFAFFSENLLVMTQEWNHRFPRKQHKLESAAYWLTSEIDVSQLPNLPKGETVIPDWRQIPPKYRLKDVFESYRRFYSICMTDVFEAYKDLTRPVPEFILTPRVAFD